MRAESKRRRQPPRPVPPSGHGARPGLSAPSTLLAPAPRAGPSGAPDCGAQAAGGGVGGAGPGSGTRCLLAELSAGGGAPGEGG